MSKTLMYILGIPLTLVVITLTLTLIAYFSVSTYHIWEKDRVYRECVKDINYLGKVVEFEGNREDMYKLNFSGDGGYYVKIPEYKNVPNCLQVLGQ
jgi:hypothetical protein